MSFEYPINQIAGLPTYPTRTLDLYHYYLSAIRFCKRLHTAVRRLHRNLSNLSLGTRLQVI